MLKNNTFYVKTYKYITSNSDLKDSVLFVLFKIYLFWNISTFVVEKIIYKIYVLIIVLYIMWCKNNQSVIEYKFAKIF